MSNPNYAFTPDESLDILTEFVKGSESQPVLEDYTELQGVINPDVRLALTSLVLQTGRTPRHHQLTTLSVLENKKSFTKVQGIIHNNLGSVEPTAIQLGKYVWPYRFGISRSQYAHMHIEGPEPFTSADDGFEAFLPILATPSNLDFNRTVLGEARRPDIQGRMRSGIDIAAREARMASHTMTGYLRTVLNLTKELIDV